VRFEKRDCPEGDLKGSLGKIGRFVEGSLPNFKWKGLAKGGKALFLPKPGGF